MEESLFVRRIPSYRATIWKGALLRTLDIELTERCNNNCRHCYINLPRDSSSRMKESSTENIKNTLGEAASLGCLSVRFTGGEPLLREDFEEIYVCARKLGMKVFLFTNAALMTPALAALFAKTPPLEKIDVSVYGLTPQSYEAVSGIPGSCEAAFRGLEHLIRHGVPFLVKSVAFPSNREEISEFESWAAALPFAEGHPSFTTFLGLRTRRDSESRNKEIRALRLSPEEQFRIQAGDRDLYLKDTRSLFAGHAGPPGAGLFPCEAGLGRASVDSYGTIQPCLLLRHPETVLSREKGGLEEAMTRFFPELRKKKASNPEYLRRCARCFLSGFCEQCPAQSWAEHGTLDTPVEACCETAHHAARRIDLIGAAEHAWEVRDWKKRIENFIKGGQPHDGQS